MLMTILNLFENDEILFYPFKYFLINFFYFVIFFSEIFIYMTFSWNYFHDETSAAIWFWLWVDSLKSLFNYYSNNVYKIFEFSSGPNSVNSAVNDIFKTKLE